MTRSMRDARDMRFDTAIVPCRLLRAAVAVVSARSFVCRRRRVGSNKEGEFVMQKVIIKSEGDSARARSHFN